MKGTHITPRQVRNALAAVFLLLLLLFLSLFQWYQRADTRLEDIAAQNGWDCLGAADRLATHLKRGTYDYMTIDAIARFDETAQHAQQPTWGQLGEVLVELENEINSPEVYNDPQLLREKSDELSDLRFHQDELFAAWEAAVEEQEQYEQTAGGEE